MKHSRIKLIGRLLVSIICVACVAMLYFVPLFPYRTVYYIQRNHHDQELCYMGSPVDKESVMAIDRILTEYGERHRIMHNTILISLRLLLDKDLLRNYTAKAGIRCPDINFSRHPDPACDLWIEARTSD